MVGKVEEDKLLEMQCIKSYKLSGGARASHEAGGKAEGPTTESFQIEAKSTSDTTAALLKGIFYNQYACA